MDTEAGCKHGPGIRGQRKRRGKNYVTYPGRPQCPSLNGPSTDSLTNQRQDTQTQYSLESQTQAVNFPASPCVWYMFSKTRPLHLDLKQNLFNRELWEALIPINPAYCVTRAVLRAPPCIPNNRQTSPPHRIWWPKTSNEIQKGAPGTPEISQCLLNSY